MEKIKKLLTAPILGTAVFLLVLLGLFYLQGFDKQSLSLIISVYGGFVATMLGLYVSLYYTREREKDQEKEINKKIMIGSLKLLWSELDLNSRSLKNLVKGYTEMPKIHEALYDNFTFLSTYCEGIKFQVFYGLISSGDMNEISKKDDIFNALQQAYYNLELMLNGIKMTSLIYRDLDSHPKPTSTDIELCWGLLEQEISKGKRTLEFVDKAKSVITDYLTEQGVTFTENRTSTS